MTINSDISSALTAVLSNSWAVELPVEPTYPAIVFEIDSDPERGWVFGGGYTQNVITVHIMARTLTEIATYKPLIRTAMEAIDGYMAEEESGDAAYEDLPDIYGYFLTFRIRT